MASIMQGTTPSITIYISPEDLSLTNVTAIELYIKNCCAIKTLTMDDLVIDTVENSITKHFTVEETAALNPQSSIVIQGRFWVGDAVIGINKIRVGVSDMMGVGADG